ncbi:MAG: hypothetical protein PHZ07_02370 [Patescibacteria group bacterium]|nr:hypothetical protein [Patescibacteria group bacterium]MDD4304246.1 hypothetical protein [Patescibacteria group bacterium]MDD4695300.1 hypothetical protein [Patescibacteria group bacterium]
MENESFQPDSYIDSEEKAMIGANKENNIRDLSKGIDITHEEEESLIKIAEKQAEKTMQEYDIEKEKNPVERLINRLNEIVQNMKEMGLEQDYEIVSKIQRRIERYIEAFKKYKEEYEDRTNKRLSVEIFLQNFNNQYERHFVKFAKGIPVTHQIDQDGGWVYGTSGTQAGGWFKNYSQIEENKKIIEDNGMEAINYSFSKNGSTEFCKSMGALEDDQEFIDIPNIYENLSKDKIDPLNYTVKLPTDIEGISLKIVREKRPDNLEEKSIHITFDDEFLKKLLT